MKALGVRTLVYEFGGHITEETINKALTII